MKFEPSMHKLSNGVTVLLDPMDLETTTVKVSFKTGSRDEQPNEYGLTHFCEHMLCKGTKRFATQKIIDDYMDYHAATRNASTGNSGLNFYGRILSDNLNILIDFFGEQIQNSLILPEKIEIERKVITDELRMFLDNPDRQLNDFISKKLFNNATFSSRALGSFENINSFTRDQMLEFLSRRLSAMNCIIGVSGKINDKDDVLNCLEKTFSFLPRTDVLENSDINYNPTIAHNSKPDRKNVKLRIIFPDIWGMEYENRYNNFCVAKFERFMIDELFEVIRRENGLSYNLNGVGYGNEKLGLSGVGTETAAENIEKCVALIAKNAFEIYNKNKITDEDLDRYVRRNKLGDADWLESASRRCDKLINFYRNYGKIYDFYGAIKLSDSVNREDVIKNSRGYFDGPMSIITQGADYAANLKSVWEENFK